MQVWKREHVDRTLLLLEHIEVHLRRIEEALLAQTQAILAQTQVLTQLVHQEELTMATLEDVQAEVSENTDVTQSAITLLNGLSQQLKDALAANDPAAIQAVVDQLDANTNALADAVAANTPASGDTGGGEVPPPPPPEEPPAEG